MLDPDRRVFGSITAKEIIGARPPATPHTRARLASELEILLAGLEGRTGDDLLRLLGEQEAANAEINSRPGAMALAQDKIRLFNLYSGMYVDAILARRDAAGRGAHAGSSALPPTSVPPEPPLQ